jgi:pyruvate,water dikinase
MKELWKFLASVLVRNSGNRRVPVAERFAHFRTIGSANDAFLQQLASLHERLEGSNWHGTNATAAAAALGSHIQLMVNSLIAMSGGRYNDLLSQYELLNCNIRRSVPPSHQIGQTPVIVWPTDVEALDPRIVGPKSARLAEVVRDTGMAVPPFFSISACAYQMFMDTSGLQDLVNQLIPSVNLYDSGDIQRFSDTLAKAFAETSVPEALQRDLLGAYRRLTALNPGVSGVAVRSSAVVEDSESSFAGQFESILNVMESGLVDAYKAVVASKYGAETLRYSMARGMLEENCAMPVLVMAMVQPSSSGVAYSRSPDRPECVMITAVRGLAQAMNNDKVIPDIFLIPGDSPEQVHISQGKSAFSLHCAADGGLHELEENPSNLRTPALGKEAAISVARVARILENQFGSPQDVEWAINEAGTLMVVQTRQLHISSENGGSRPAAQVEGYRVLAHGERASGGVSSGPVYHLTNFQALDRVPEGAVLCIPVTSPRVASVLGRVHAVVAAAGSPTGHMATVAREFDIPCVVGAENALFVAPEGAVVTVDGDAGIVYEGLVAERLRPEERCNSAPRQRDPMRQSLRVFLEKVAPLTLTEPDSPSFDPEHCKTLHDIARYVHQKAMMEMFNSERFSPEERRASHRLLWRVPIEVMLLDLEEGLAPNAGKNVTVDEIRSAPLLALIEGMTDPRLRWAGPVGFDFKGFMSVVVRSAADDQRYGEPNYCLCARDYVHFASRLAYHFATVDALCSRSVNENYARFLFFGGAAVATRREWRAHFLAMVLQANQFSVKQVGDRVEGVLAKRNPEQIEEALVMLGRLMVASRHLDMVIENQAVAQALAQAFLSGDYAFERVRRTAV